MLLLGNKDHRKRDIDAVTAPLNAHMLQAYSCVRKQAQALRATGLMMNETNSTHFSYTQRCFICTARVCFITDSS